jgi:hypothetical protein
MQISGIYDEITNFENIFFNTDSPLRILLSSAVKIYIIIYLTEQIIILLTLPKHWRASKITAVILSILLKQWRIN